MVTIMAIVSSTKYLEKPQYLALVREASIDAHLLDLGHEDLVFVIVIVIVIVDDYNDLQESHYSLQW